MLTIQYSFNCWHIKIWGKQEHCSLLLLLLVLINSSLIGSRHISQITTGSWVSSHENPHRIWLQAGNGWWTYWCCFWPLNISLPSTLSVGRIDTLFNILHFWRSYFKFRTRYWRETCLLFYLFAGGYPLKEIMAINDWSKVSNIFHHL